MLADYQEAFHQQIRKIQDEVCGQLKTLDPDISLTETHWKRKDHEGQEGGGGITRAFEGSVFENAGVNSSLIHGKINPSFAEKLGV